jgi:4-oxalocrotonate tautomerase
MPSIRVEMFEGRNVEQKRALAKELTEATVRALGVPADSVDIIMFDIPKHDWATAGTLWSERKPSTPKAT